MSKSNKDSLTLSIAGHELQMRNHPTKEGRQRFVVLAKKRDGTPNWSGLKFGVGIPALSDELPDSVEVDGVQVTLTRGVTESDNEKMSGDADVTVNGEDLIARISVSRVNLGDDDEDGPKEAWNIIAKTVRAGGGGFTVHDLASLS